MSRNFSRSISPRFQSLGIFHPFVSNHWKAALTCGAMMAAMFAGAGCELRRAMYDQPKIARPQTESKFWADGMGSRPLVEGVVPWTPGVYFEDVLLTDGKMIGPASNLVDSTFYPFPIGANDLIRGKERFEIFCSPCHDRAGTGNGMIVKRGFRKPPSYHDPRLVAAPPGYFYGVIKNGFGQMQGYAPQIPVEDRWRIAAYIRVLQFSQGADPKELPQELAAKLPK